MEEKFNNLEHMDLIIEKQENSSQQFSFGKFHLNKKTLYILGASLLAIIMIIIIIIIICTSGGNDDDNDKKGDGEKEEEKEKEEEEGEEEKKEEEEKEEMDEKLEKFSLKGIYIYHIMIMNGLNF